MSALEQALAYAGENHEPALADLKSLLRIPSVSTLAEHDADMAAAAQWLASRLTDLSFENVAVMPTARHPVVYGDWLHASADAPTVLFYGHYDVQPADPLEEWATPPFEPTVRGENIYARGASDMKGQVVAFLRAVEAMVRGGGLPLNLKFMIEGEEEIGSPSLADFIREHKELLACDLCLNADSGILDADLPAITYALRGLAYFEIRLQGPKGDLHSGRFGGVVDNPAQVLCELIAGMRDAQGRVQLPGFYDRVRPLSDEERADYARLPTDDAWWLEQTGAPALFGEGGYSASERASARPTLDVNGLLSGFTGKGSKTVLPARAMAKVSMRLVPDQDPDEIHQSLLRYLEQHAPPTVTWEVESMAGAPPAIVERDSPAVQAASRALEEVWGKTPLFTREGGTIPVVGLIQQLLGVDSLLLGFGLPDDNLHAPNEKLHLPTYYRGIETYIRFAHALGAR